MAEDVAELETRPAELKRSEKPDPAPTRENNDPSQAKDGESKHREAQEADKLPAPLQRRPFVVVGLVVAIFAAWCCTSFSGHTRTYGPPMLM
jgi:membrane fusion protein (multidrug efflux system)